MLYRCFLEPIKKCDFPSKPSLCLTVGLFSTSCLPAQVYGNHTDMLWVIFIHKWPAILELWERCGKIPQAKLSIITERNPISALHTDQLTTLEGTKEGFYYHYWYCASWIEFQAYKPSYFEGFLTALSPTWGHQWGSKHPWDGGRTLSSLLPPIPTNWLPQCEVP